jgi:hypothetical protein
MNNRLKDLLTSVIAILKVQSMFLNFEMYKSVATAYIGA